jgi:RNA methyltransferase, TrmH family
MISKSKIKIIHSLALKKYREEYQLFIAEGNKIVTDILESDIVIEYLFSTREVLSTFKVTPDKVKEVYETDINEISKISNQKSSPQCIAICRIPENRIPAADNIEDLILCLDTVQDPGNLGTIVRLADWFGINDIICSNTTADLYNPKTVQATMGSIANVRVHYTELEQFIMGALEHKVTVLGTFLQGENIYTAHLPQKGVVVMGNEGTGIQPALMKLIPRKITIPRFLQDTGRSESLNVSLAAAIICSEFRRRLC